MGVLPEDGRSSGCFTNGASLIDVRRWRPSRTVTPALAMGCAHLGHPRSAGDRPPRERCSSSGVARDVQDHADPALKQRTKARRSDRPAIFGSSG
jgi:hypothetical protein